VSAVHEHADDERVLYSALGLTVPDGHDHPDVEAAARELLRIYGTEPERTAA
jgi:hypothetical protein